MQKNDINKIYHKYVGSKVTKINRNENFAVYNCHMYTQIVWNLRLVTNIIDYKAKNIFVFKTLILTHIGLHLNMSIYVKFAFFHLKE